MSKLREWWDRFLATIAGPPVPEQDRVVIDPKPRLRPDNPTNQLFHEVKPTPGLGPTHLPPEEQP